MLGIIQGLRALGNSMAWIVLPLMSTAYLSTLFLSALTLAFLFLCRFMMDGLLSCSSRSLAGSSDSSMSSAFLMSCLLSDTLRMSHTLTWSSGSLAVSFSHPAV